MFRDSTTLKIQKKDKSTSNNYEKINVSQNLVPSLIYLYELVLRSMLHLQQLSFIAFNKY